MSFDAVESADHYAQHVSGELFDPLKAQQSHADSRLLPGVIQREIEKVRSADWLIFHFPLWWFAPPAVLKGWFDRVFVHGLLHTVEQRFDHGLCKGKKALFCVTTGATDAECAFNGKEGDVQMLLWPSAYTLRYLGFTVLTHKLVHGVHGYFEGCEQQQLESRLSTVLQQQAGLIKGFDTRDTLQFNTDSHFDAHGTLKKESPGLSSFIRHNR